MTTEFTIQLFVNISVRDTFLLVFNSMKQSLAYLNFVLYTNRLLLSLLVLAICADLSHYGYFELSNTGVCNNINNGCILFSCSSARPEPRLAINLNDHFIQLHSVILTLA